MVREVREIWEVREVWEMVWDMVMEVPGINISHFVGINFGHSGRSGRFKGLFHSVDFGDPEHEKSRKHKVF